jgi:hypothetical protein
MVPVVVEMVMMCRSTVLSYQAPVLGGNRVVQAGDFMVVSVVGFG